jgi:hypothetical protein
LKFRHKKKSLKSYIRRVTNNTRKKTGNEIREHLIKKLMESTKRIRNIYHTETRNEQRFRMKIIAWNSTRPSKVSPNHPSLLTAHTLTSVQSTHKRGSCHFVFTPAASKNWQSKTIPTYVEDERTPVASWLIEACNIHIFVTINCRLVTKIGVGLKTHSGSNIETKLVGYKISLLKKMFMF